MFLVSAIGAILIFMVIAILIMLRRITFVIGIQHIRMRDIERGLGMERNWLIHGLDKKAKGELDELDYSIAKKINRVDKINLNKHTPPARRMVILILFSVIFLWVLIISFVNWPSFRFWINAIFFPPT
jgi:hypothetical protein